MIMMSLKQIYFMIVTLLTSFKNCNIVQTSLYNINAFICIENGASVSGKK